MRKKLLRFLSAMALTPLLLINTTSPKSVNATENNYEYKSVGYFFQRNGNLLNLDVSKITHLNYSFGLIYHNENIEGKPINPDTVVPNDPSKLHTVYLPDKVKSDLTLVPELKKKNPNLKVLLSIGGWEARGFSDAASTEESRKIFANSCLDVLNTYKLDGIDIDWEYPVNGGWGAIDSKPEDKENYTLLLQELKSTLPEDKLLTIAGAANKGFLTDWTEFDKILPLLDYINVMAYDLAYGSCYHNSALYPSKEFPTKLAGDDYSVDMIINNYLNAGADSRKLNLGLPFYSRIPRVAVEAAPDWDNGGIPATTPYFNEKELTDAIIATGAKSLDYNYLVQFLINKNGFTRKWDADAKVPYLTYKDHAGVDQFAITYEDEESFSYKTQYIKDKRLGGAMFWEFAADYNNSLATKLANDLGIFKESTLPNPTPKPVDPNPPTGEKNDVVIPSLLILSLSAFIFLKAKKIS